MITRIVNSVGTASQIGGRIGSTLREVCEIGEEDSPGVIRNKVHHRLAELAADLPPDLRTVVLAAFAICAEARHPLYQQRVGWAAERLDRDPRTIRRRVDEGINHLAQLAAAGGRAR
jgi:hypothetical protein